MSPLACGPPLSPSVAADIRRQMVLEHCKWDPQVEDVTSLCPFPLLLAAGAWRQLKRWSEQLADETLRAEAELLQKPELLRWLGLPRAVLRVLQGAPGRPAVSAARIMRFDFHWTTEGWRISEVNSDVPGGFIESSAFTQLVARHMSGALPAGDPARAYAMALATSTTRTAGLVHATAYSDDRQVMVYLSRQLQKCGVQSYLISPADVTWQSGQSRLATGAGPVNADVLVRFFPAEWLPNLGRRPAWESFYAGSVTPLSNPAGALVTQSKRFPLLWNRLSVRLPTWNELLPETCDPGRVRWRGDERWVLKPALGRVGEAIGLRGITSSRDWTRIARSVSWWPADWAAQRRFEMIPLPGPVRPIYPVIGVYTVGREAVGIYGRLARRPLIDHLAQDVAVLVTSETPREEACNSQFKDQVFAL